MTKSMQLFHLILKYLFNFKYIIILLFFTTSIKGQYDTTKANAYLCPQLYRKMFHGSTPRGNESAGVFKAIQGVLNPNECVYKCCLDKNCNIVFMTDLKCFHVECVSSEMCLPKRSNNADVRDQVSMILVKPVGEDSWEDLLTNSIDEESYHEGRESYERGRIDPYKEIMQMSESDFNYGIGCNVGIPSTCPNNEECIQNMPKSRAGTCNCKLGYSRNRESECTITMPGLEESAIKGILEKTGLLDMNTTTPISKKNLSITVESKQVKLPDNKVSLTAAVSPPPGEGEKYNFEWTSLRKPDGSQALKQQNGEVMELTKLSEGLYTFKVNVSSETAYGETFVNVTVMPASRINQPPQIIITPANQTIKLPNTGAVLDASSSTDDDKIISYHWELQQGPIGYQPQLVDASTLQLKDLSLPGNYTFKLTVTDSDKAVSISTANITVLKITDYPPEANAGQDIIIYFPNNKITLNGNLSTDDHMISTWEWTKSSDDADKAVDMQDTRTPYLKLSDLEEGMYTFQLKVTDSANQSSVASVHVFVKPPTNSPPKAKTGENITISLPQTWAIIDASNSTDDNKIIGYKWEQLAGPSNGVFENSNASRTNVTNLTKGTYTFRVSVTDESKNIDNATLFVIVNQNKNQKPKSNAGDDFEVILPRNGIYVNGSKSSDDWAIVKWKWTRTDSSLAFGNIVEDSDDTPILIITDTVPGKYVFNLTVFDEQGLSDTDTVVITVKNDPKLYYLIDMIIDKNVNELTQLQFNTLKGKLALLVEENAKLQVRHLKSQRSTQRAVIRFFVENAESKPIIANEVVQHLRKKLKVDASLLGFSISNLQTAICQNNCSGHGVCDERSRKCICEAFWMPDMFRAYLATGLDSDCSWNTLYVVLGVICGTVGLGASIWGAVYLCMNRCSCRRTPKTTTYKLIENTEDLPAYSRKVDLSDTDTDSDVVFESSHKKMASRFNSESRNGNKSMRNGNVKMSRRIKT